MLDMTRSDHSLVNLPVWCYLLETTDGPILIDTGMPDRCVGRPDLFVAPGEEPTIVPQMKQEDGIMAILARAGYTPRDVACVVSTHRHFDHAGGNCHFVDVDLVVQQLEYDAMVADLKAPDAFDFWSSTDLRYRVIQGDYALAPGIELVFTPGHSAGHQSVLVETPTSGSVLLTIDAAYQASNYEEGIPFAVADVDKARASIAKLQSIARSEKSTVFFGHDILQERTVRPYPAFY